VPSTAAPPRFCKARALPFFSTTANALALNADNILLLLDFMSSWTEVQQAPSGFHQPALVVSGFGCNFAFRGKDLSGLSIDLA
jgi:hypothetical protein